MLKKQKIHVKVGDIVRIISGFSKNETGEVIKINPKNGKIIVKGINFKFKQMNGSFKLINLTNFIFGIWFYMLKLKINSLYNQSSSFGWNVYSI